MRARGLRRDEVDRELRARLEAIVARPAVFQDECMLAESADEARTYDGSLSMTVTSPENAGSPSKKHAIALPTAPPPIITTFLPAMACRPCIPR